MGWFDDYIRQIKAQDQEVFEDSLLHMAASVMGRREAVEMLDERIVAKAAIDEVMKFYRFRPVEIPNSIEEIEDQLDYALHPCGVMYRAVSLKGDWYRDAYGPIIARRREDGLAVALIPRRYKGYSFLDPATGERVHLNRRTAAQFDEKALCFYRPLPQRRLTVTDLLAYLKGSLNTRDILMLVLLTLMVTLVGMIMPQIIRVLTGPVAESGNMPMLAGTAVFIVCVTVSSTLLSVVRGLGLSRIETKASLSVEAAVMSRILNLPAGFFREYVSGDLASRFNTVKQLCSLLIGGVFSVGLSSLVSLLYVTQIFRYAPALVLPALVIIAVTVLITLAATRMKMKYSKKSMEANAKSQGISFALISGVQKIKGAGAEKRAFSKWGHAYADVAAYTYDIPLFLKIHTVITTAVTLAGTILLYYLAVRTRVSPSEYLAFNAAYGMVMGAFAALTGVAMSIAGIKPILEMAEPILRAEPEAAENKEVLTALSGNIELSNVSFRYRDSMPYVVDSMDLKIKAGQYVAIVGTTGCGKTTLMRLLMGFEKPDKGAVFYDGKDIAHVDLRSLRRQIGAVMQDGSLFQGDIYSNIVITAPHLTLNDAWEAAEMAGIADDIREMPMGMNTVVAEGQGGISGGQKQRLMIARAVAPKPKILMFDEATSALDNVTQRQVSEALDRLDCTRIVIAHRLSTIRHCDRILVLDQGRIAEDGSYEELIAADGLFARLVERQRLDKE